MQANFQHERKVEVDKQLKGFDQASCKNTGIVFENNRKGSIRSICLSRA